MAISKDVEFKGIKVKDAYITVRCPTIHAGNDRVSFGVHFSVTPDSGAFDSIIAECGYDLLGDNPVEQAYLYLKTLPEFSDATDC